MSRLFYHVMQDNTGNLLFDVSGTMRLAGTGTAATIYGDEALTIPIANPMTNHPSFGSFKCFLGSGDYDFYMAKAGYTFETLTGVQGHGTMAQQDSTLVNISGGVISGLSAFQVAGDATFSTHVGIGVAPDPLYALVTGSQARVGGNLGVAVNLIVSGSGEIDGPLGVGTPAVATNKIQLNYNKTTELGIAIKPTDTDASANAAIYFQNVAVAPVGSITTSATLTSYNTTSDARLKEDVTPLVGALDVVRDIRVVSFRWRADDSPGVGFLGHELQALVPEAVTGEPDAVNPDGTIQPQQVDHSKLVPYLTSAVQMLLARVEALEARLA